MKICEILASTGEGGLEKHMLDLCNTMASQGHEVHVVVDPYFAQRFAPGVYVHCLNMQRSRNNPVLLWQLLQLLKTIDADVVHAQANKAASLLSRVQGFIKAACVGTIHNQKSKSAMFRSMDAVIGVSQGACSVVDHQNKHCIYNGVDQTLASDAKQCRQELLALAGVDGNRPVAVALVRLVEVKRIDVLLDAWRDIDADLLIIGDGLLRAELEQQGQALVDKGTVHFCGFVKDAARLLPGADVMVISSDREGFPYAMVEALCARIPVISTQVAAAKEALPESLQVSLGDSVQLGSKVQHFLSDKQTYSQDLEGLFHWASEVLSVDYMTRATVDVLAAEYNKKVSV